MARVSCGNVVVCFDIGNIMGLKISRDQGIKDGNVIICLQRLENFQMDKFPTGHPWDTMEDATDHPGCSSMTMVQ